MITYKFRGELLAAATGAMWDTPENGDLAAVVVVAATASKEERARFHALAIEISRERDERMMNEWQTPATT